MQTEEEEEKRETKWIVVHVLEKKINPNLFIFLMPLYNLKILKI